jgi:beta-glucosidase
MVDIGRDPRWGRVVEGAGEDPYLGSVMAVSRVRGFQGEDLRATNTVLATAKHFVAYGGAEGGRDYNTVDISERTLHEVYLPPFHAAVRAGVGSIMPAFNEIAGIPMHAHRPLIEETLRAEWGFDGVLISDYTGVMELIPHGVAEDSTAAGILGLNAGVDIDMVAGIYLNKIPAAVRAGRLSESTIDASVRRVLAAKYRLGLFEDPYLYSDATREREWTLTPAHREAARQVALESMVLLKNQNNALPLSRSIRTLAVIGPLADDRRIMLGSWAAAGRAEDAITPLAGIRDLLGQGTRVLHARGAGVTEMDTTGFAEAVRIASQADAVILFLGEHHDLSAEANNRTSLDLPGVQQQLAGAIVGTGKPVVAVIMNGRPLSIPWLADNGPAILEAWVPGEEAGPAIAQVLFGDYNPAGRLPDTFPRNVGQVPIYYNHKNTGRPPDPANKYTSKYLDVPWTPLYPFGHGLSYTTFEYRDISLDRSRIGRADSVTVRVRVANTGQRAGDEVVQVYIRDDVASVTRPVKELRGFRRIRLAPGEEQTVTFVLGPDALSFLDAQMRRIVEPGTFTVWAGPSSAQGIEARFEVVER